MSLPPELLDAKIVLVSVVSDDIVIPGPQHAIASKTQNENIALIAKYSDITIYMQFPLSGVESFPYLSGNYR